MADAGEDHGEAMFVGCCDDLVVLQAATRLNEGADAGFGNHVEAVAKRKEGV